jgi:hypothetical protein
MVLLFIGWAGVIGSVIDGVVSVAAIWLATTTNPSGYSMSVESLFRDHLTWLYWVKQVAFSILPNDFVARVFAIPALVLFPVRVVVSGLIGKWAFSAAARCKRGVTMAEESFVGISRPTSPSTRPAKTQAREGRR